MRVREVKARRFKTVKIVGDKVYEYEYYTLPIDVYIRKHVVEKHGTDFIVEIDEDRGVITIKPKKLTEKKTLKVRG